MGTNYYLHLNPCKRCKRFDVLHIGKSSGGWKFMFQWIDGKVESIKDWLLLLHKGEIFDEYDEKVSFGEFWEMVTRKQEESPQLYEGMFLIEDYNFMKGDFS